MRRWHQDRDLMLARHKIAARYYHVSWINDLSRWRKRKPLDCGRPRCGVCHNGKFHIPKARENHKREAIRFDIDAY